MSKAGLEGEGDLERLADGRENFIPLHSADLVSYLAQHPSVPDEDVIAFRQLAALILSLLHHVYRQRHEYLTHVYLPLDPDGDRVLLSVPTDAHREQISDDLAGRVRDALGRANYHRLAPDDIQRALKAASQWGVRTRVDFDAMQRLEVYARGCLIGHRYVRDWRRLFRQKEVEVPLYQRLVVFFQTRESHPNDKFDSRCVYLRMFKNVPQQDVDMMLPATGIQMSWIDHSKIVVPSLYAAAMTLWRFLRNVLIWTFFGVFKTVGLIVLILFALGFGVKSMFTYRTATRRRYMLNMTQSLYYQNLDNNAGVLLRLLDEGEQQEACEAVLCYFATAFLLRESGSVSLEAIDQACEELLRTATDLNIDFDVESTARNLERMGILSLDENGWRALPLDEAKQLLDETWDNWFRS